MNPTRRHHRADRRDQGFTLIEILVVIIIIGILAAIAIPVFLNQRKKGQVASVKADLKSTAILMEAANTEGGYPTALPALTRTSPGVTLRLMDGSASSGGSGLSANDQLFTTFLGQCQGHARVSRCEYDPNGTPATQGNLKSTFSHPVRGSMTYYSNAGDPVPSWLLETVGWTGGAVRVPARGTAITVAAPTPAGPKTEFCIEGEHNLVPGEIWKWDSDGGGLLKGVC